jgi:uroporphyrinogen decarboxylase
MFYQRARLLADCRRDEYVERFAEDSLDLVRAIDHDLILLELNPPKNDPWRITKITDAGWTETDEENGLWRKFAYEPDKQTVTEIDSTEKTEGRKGIERHLDALEAAECRIDVSCFDAVREVCRRAGDELFCMAKIPDLVPSNRSWYTSFMEIGMLDPELTERICGNYTRYALEAARGYIECGVHGVMIATDWAVNSGPLFPPWFLERYMVPQVNAVAELCHSRGVKVMKHSDGNIMPIADLFFSMEVDAYQSIEPYAGMDLGFIKREYGNDLLLMGNVDCGRTLPFGSCEEIAAETKECIRAAAPGGGYILSSSNTISYPIPVDALFAMIETAHEFGAYPIDLEG